MKRRAKIFLVGLLAAPVLLALSFLVLDMSLDFAVRHWPEGSSKKVLPGDMARLDRSFVAYDRKAMEELNHGAAARDEAAIKELVASGRVFVVEAGTRAKVIEPGLLVSLVVVQDGDYAGKTGLVASEFVK